MDLRVTNFFNAWYKPKYKMSNEDWIFIGVLVTACINAFGIGLIVGLIIS